MADAQQWGLTANGLYWATATPNIGVEYAFHSKMSIAGLVQYNPFTYAKNRKMKHLAGQLEYRYWLSDVFKGHYLGVHATGGIFNFSNLLWVSSKTIVSRGNCMVADSPTVTSGSSATGSTLASISD